MEPGYREGEFSRHNGYSSYPRGSDRKRSSNPCSSPRESSHPPSYQDSHEARFCRPRVPTTTHYHTSQTARPPSETSNRNPKYPASSKSTRGRSGDYSYRSPLSPPRKDRSSTSTRLPAKVETSSDPNAGWRWLTVVTKKVRPYLPNVDHLARTGYTNSVIRNDPHDLRREDDPKVARGNDIRNFRESVETNKEKIPTDIFEDIRGIYNSHFYRPVDEEEQ